MSFGRGLAQIGVGAAEGFFGELRYRQEQQQKQQLIQLQMEKLRRELEPTTIDVAKVSLVTEAMKKGIDVPDSVRNNTFQSLMDNIKTPTQAKYLGKVMGAMGPSGGESPSLEEIYAAPGGMAPISARPSTVSVNDAEQELILKSLGIYSSQQMAELRGETSLRSQELRNQNQKELEGVKSQHRKELDDLTRNFNAEQKRLQREHDERMNRERIKGRQSTAPESPQSKLLRSNISKWLSAIEADKNALTKAEPFSIEPKAIKEKRRQDRINQIRTNQKLVREALDKNPSMKAAIPNIDTILEDVGGAPAAPAAPTAVDNSVSKAYSVEKAPAEVKSLDEAKALPAGSKFKYKGSIYEKTEKGAKPVK